MRGRLLSDALDWLEKRPEDLTDVERDFVTESSRKEDKKKPVFSVPVPATCMRLKIYARSLFYIGFIVLLSTAAYLTITSVLNHRKERATRGAAVIALARQYAYKDPLISTLLLSEVKDYDAGEADRKSALEIARSFYPEIMLRSDGAVRWLEFAPDGRTLVTAGDGGVEPWDPNKWKNVRTIADNSRPMVSASFNGWFPELAKAKGAPGRIDRVATTNVDGVVQMLTFDGKELMKFAGGNLDPSFFSNCVNQKAVGKLSTQEINNLKKPA